ncbi:terminase small subunit [Ligilactobacillus agilis]|uniref:Phage terminase small subunit n=1 Tax=Ligilactobacillus agilis TaxID=1601 RepID=A0A6F9Y2K7_9LACO|nr:terminase small subunit [Ligilactobacillus agilis]GET11625.1 phage terminase small subunit [Ligilactobacillus agilis]
MKKLNPKQKAFADEYIKTGNAYQSALEAGYSEKYAKAQSSKLLENVGISSYISERLKQIEDEKIMDIKEVMQRLSAIARGEVYEEQVTNKGDVVIVSVKTSDRIRAMELIGKRVGAWTDKKEVTGNLNIDVGVDEWDGD